MIPTQAQKEQFLREYEDLCRRHGLMVEACGCCDSPWIEPVVVPQELEEHLQHLRFKADLADPPAKAPTEKPAGPGRRPFKELTKPLDQEAIGGRIAEIVERLGRRQGGDARR